MNLTPEKCAKLERELRVELEPFIQLKMRILNLSVSPFIVYEGGTIEHHYTDKEKEQLAKVDELIEERIDSFCKRHNSPRPT